MSSVSFIAPLPSHRRRASSICMAIRTSSRPRAEKLMKSVNLALPVCGFARGRRPEETISFDQLTKLGGSIKGALDAPETAPYQGRRLQLSFSYFGQGLFGPPQ